MNEKGSQRHYKKPKTRNKKRRVISTPKEVVVLNRTSEKRMGLKSPAAQAQALVEAMADISYPRSKTI
jgi:hypothetical protein